MVLAWIRNSAAILSKRRKRRETKTKFRSTWGTVNKLQGLALATFKERRQEHVDSAIKHE